MTIIMVPTDMSIPTISQLITRQERIITQTKLTMGLIEESAQNSKQDTNN